MDLQSPVQLLVERLQRVMQPPSAGPSHGMLRGMHVVENIDGEDAPFFRRFQQSRIIRNSKILPEPVNMGVLLHRLSQVEDQEFTAFSGKKGDVLFVT